MTDNPYEPPAEQSVAGTVSGPVITRYRDSLQNLRTTFQKTIERAKLKVWPKLFKNLRSTRETELADQFPLQAVTAWMGNSQLVASRHYLQLRDEHFDRASSEVAIRPQGERQDDTGTKTDSVAPPVALNVRDHGRTEAKSKKETRGKTKVFRGLSSSFVSVRDELMGAEGLEPPTPSV